jgi:uncharacterized cupin superfamily protein
MTRPLINIDELDYVRIGKGDTFQADRAHVSPLIGARKLGYAVIRVPPGKRAWPYHAHHAVEEMFFVISGIGTLRHAGKEYAIRAGDFICSPADPGQPHQIVNTSEDDLTYIALSNEAEMDVMLYPESGKYGVWHGDASNLESPDNFLKFARIQDAVDYWEGEEDQ